MRSRSRSARYDQRVTFHALTIDRDPKFNTRNKTWNALPAVYARVEDVPPNRGEQIADGVDVRRQTCRVWIRWRAGISADMRVMIRGIEHEIIGGPTEIGRRDELLIVCEAMSTMGDGA